ncbi:MAG: PASTA domain-containing protein [Saprospiraceae bacterium]|nr:PASTA domain-containing protein [Saprospiraceae bacterium]
MKEFFKFLISKDFLKQLAYIVVFLILMLFLVLAWLRFYTNHGQKLELPDYVLQNYQDATKDAQSKSFEIIVTDSIHKVGKEGGLIIDQNPEPGSMVKEKRKIYVNITKYSPDKIKVSDLPVLYGKDFDQKRTELKYLDITSKIKSEKHDPGEPNHILEVWYDNKLIIDSKTIETTVEINKGGSLEFVISKREGGKGLIPNLMCREYSAAETMALLSKFRIGNVTELGEITDRNTAFVVSQDPSSDGLTELSFNSDISVTITQNRPEDCQ